MADTGRAGKGKGREERCELDSFLNFKISKEGRFEAYLLKEGRKRRWRVSGEREDRIFPHDELKSMVAGGRRKRKERVASR